MTHPTDEELDALVNWLDELPCCHDGPHKTSARCKTCEKSAADAITALRAQLAEVKADKEKLGRELNLARYGQPDFSWQVHKEALAAANARADRAEAALAAKAVMHDMRHGNGLEGLRVNPSRLAAALRAIEEGEA